ncbi:translation initiation factor IF-3 [Planctomycetota bacterium]|nr:translation initiation factor IF-3 [Planctomycetota bacterium]
MIGRRRSRIPLPPPEHANRARCNDKIRSPQVRLIDQQGEQVGVVSILDALQRAQAAGLDLVEVAAEAKPPVCRIQDYSKFLFEQQKKERQTKSHAHRTETKEVRLTPVTGQGDVDIKVKHAREFLEAGHKVLLMVVFRGRQLAHRELGLEMIKKFTVQVEDLAKLEQEPKMEGKRMHAMLAPAKKH